jgi:adenylate cyclase
MSLFTELKRRNVFRVGLFYIVAAWVVVQVAETLLPVFEVPDSAIRAIVLILALGFPLALVFSWIFELTPDGLKLDKNAQGDPATQRETTQKLNWATLVAAVLAIGLLVADRLVPESMPERPSVTTLESTAADDRIATAIEAEVNPASIAVLPFDDLSPMGDQQYFSDGIAEEILNVLVRIEALEVASRTSAFRFRDPTELGIPGIARALEVRHVLEGSVRKAGDTIRVTAQLIDGNTDKHLWSETYDRSLSAENVFSIQDDIATSIVDALRDTIELPETARATVEVRTGNLDAYDLFLQGRALFNARDAMDTADSLLARAVELDPEFADAWAIRAAIYMLDSEYGDLDLDRASAVRAVEGFAGQALALQPRHSLALAVLAFNRVIESRSGRTKHTIGAIINDLKRAIEIDPKNASARNWLGVTYGETGELDLALEQFTRCAEDDPYYAPCVENIYDTLVSLGRMDEALSAYVQTLETGAVTTQWTNFPLLAHFDLKAHFLFAANLPYYLPGWSRQDELWEAWQDLDADHSELARDLEIFVKERALLKTYGGPTLLLVPLGVGYEMTPFSALIWGKAYGRYRQSDEFRTRVNSLSLPEYWREHGFPPQCRPTVGPDGEDDFECT